MQPSTITFGDIRKRVRRQVGDDFAGRFGDDDIARWINDAQREIVLANNLLQKRISIPLAVDVDQYSVPNDVMLLHSITYDGVPLAALDLKEFQDLNRDAESRTTGTPTNFTIWAGKIWVHPYPGLGSTGFLDLNVFYTRLPTNIDGTSDGQLLDLPVLYQSRILEYCLAQASEMDEDREGYALKMQEFQTGVANTKDETDWQVRDRYPGITVAPEDYDHLYNGVFW